MSKSSMSFQEFGNLLQYIQKNNSPFFVKYPRPSVKYVEPVMDMRDNSVFAVRIRGFGFEDQDFHTQNECSDLPDSLETRIRAFLDTPLKTT